MNEANIKNSPIAFSQLAHPGRRFQGQYIDGGIAIAIYILGLVLINTLGFESDAAKMGVLVLPIAYYVLSDALPAGQSVGKKMLRMAVVSKKTGEPCSIIQTIVRNIFGPFLGLIDMVLIFTDKRQRLGDLLAGTLVINVPKSETIAIPEN